MTSHLRRIIFFSLFRATDFLPQPPALRSPQESGLKCDLQYTKMNVAI